MNDSGRFEDLIDHLMSFSGEPDVIGITRETDSVTMRFLDSLTGSWSASVRFYRDGTRVAKSEGQGHDQVTLTSWSRDKDEHWIGVPAHGKGGQSGR